MGQFRDLVESSARDVPLQETLRKVLNFTSKGWEAAKAHALKAVETDNRMRVWLSDDTHTQGLLFRCHLGRVHIDAPIGMSPSFFWYNVLLSMSNPPSLSMCNFWVLLQMSHDF